MKEKKMNKKIIMLLMMFMGVTTMVAGDQPEVITLNMIVGMNSPESTIEMFKDAERLRIRDWTQAEMNEEQMSGAQLGICTNGTELVFLKNDEVVALYPVQYLSRDEVYSLYLLCNVILKKME
jgi:hypothetical protein